MVWPAVWAKAWEGDQNLVLDRSGIAEGFMCIGCLEKRLGRQLNYADFTDAPINYPFDPWMTQRLRLAMLRRPPAPPNRGAGTVRTVRRVRRRNVS